MLTLIEDFAATTLSPDRPTPAGIGRHGALALGFERRAGRTVLAHQYWRPPLQIMRAIEDASGTLCVYLLSPTGGVVQGDQYQIDIRVGAEAHALITTQAATKVYRMPDGAASQTVKIEVGENAILEYVPDPLILFADADFTQTLEITLRPGALLLIHDLIMPGRLARGEVLQFRSFRSKVVVRDEGGLLLYDAMHARPRENDLLRLGLLEGRPCWGSWYLLGDLDKWGIDAPAFCASHHAALTENGSLGSLSTLARNGLVGRITGKTLAPLSQHVETLRQQVRTQFLHLPETAIRK